MDLTVRQRPNVTGFRFSAAANFDGSFTAFQTVPNYGYRSATAPEGDYVGSPFRDECRFLFNPSDYTGGVAAVRDDKPWFIRIEPRNPDGTFGTPEAMHMIMPYSSQPFRAVQLQGTAPSGADLTASLEIQLPMQCNNWVFKNTGAAGLWLAFERGAVAGPEFFVDTDIPTDQYELTYTSASQLFIRGNAGTTTFTAILTERNNSIGS